MQYENSQAKSTLFKAFVEESVLKDDSFFFNSDSVWSMETIDSFLKEFNIKGKDKTFWGKLHEQFLKLNGRQYYELMFDALYMFFLFPSEISDEGKINSVLEVIHFWKADLRSSDEQIRSTVRHSRKEEYDSHKVLKDSIGSSGGIQQRYWREIKWMLEIISKMKSQRENPSRVVGNTMQEFEYLILKHEESSPQLRHIFLYLIDPLRYERISSTGQKIQIVRGLGPEYLNELDNWQEKAYQPDKIDEVILRIRDEIVAKKVSKDAKYDPTKFDFYDDTEIGAKWKGNYVANAFEVLTKFSKQVILYGAPGTGKTYNAMKIVEDFLGQMPALHLENCRYRNNESNFKSVTWDLVQFNQAYAYEDFVEGIFPNATGNGVLEVKPGIFRKLCKAALENPEKTFILIIDEINRGNIPKIMGELLFALEYRNEPVRLHYSQEELIVPDNVYLIGTMNTADKSIAMLDVALRRRFWFVKCEPQRSVIEDRFKSLSGEPKKVAEIALRLFTWLNGDEHKKERGRIEDELGENSDVEGLKIGHSYFLKLAENGQPTFEDLKAIWFYSIVPLLEEYCSFNRGLLDKMLTYGKDICLANRTNFTLDNLTKLPNK